MCVYLSLRVFSKVGSEWVSEAHIIAIFSFFILFVIVSHLCRVCWPFAPFRFRAPSLRQPLLVVLLFPPLSLRGMCFVFFGFFCIIVVCLASSVQAGFSMACVLLNHAPAMDKAQG